MKLLGIFQNNRFQHRFLVVITLLIIGGLLANFSSEQSTQGGAELHPLNIYGIVLTAQDKTYAIENISISGQYKNIPFYAKPEYNFVDPAVNITRIDLADIKSITIPKDLQAALHKFKHREYIEVMVEFKKSDKKPENFIMERIKKIFCYEKIDKTPTHKKEIALEALQKLTIEGYTCRIDSIAN